MSISLSPFSLERVVRAVEKVRQRLLRAASALEQAKIDYAIAGGNAVAAWVARVDETAVRNTRDVDMLIRRQDLSLVAQALEAIGFLFRHSAGLDMFLDGDAAKARDAIHLVFAGEKVKPEDLLPNPDVTEYEPADGFRVLRLEPLVQMKLTAFRDKDRTHLRDLIDVELIDQNWVAKFPKELGERLQQLLDTPGG